ncbi:protein DCL, chloroplastic-like [Chenopodium quinoa]|uniref:protein DCL, chloroplastic-like n=1 Tax=Chenopodium quinoa TaxID=63459 RepID=UPI000B77DDCC|nr:protein DCL, chloroplastic-like [Chenopodium quinoa]
MSLISSISSSNINLLGTFISSCSSSSTLSLPSSVYLHQIQQRRCCCALKTGSPESYGPDLLRKPVVSPPSHAENSVENHTENLEGENSFERVADRESWVDWEDQILEDTVPLVGFVRMILHSGKYQSGDRLTAEHEKMILERLLPYHPECDNKIGCGVDYITIGYHPQFQDSRCMFIVRKDGEFIDFSYWKCIKGFIRKNYPLYAESFILKHFRRRRRYE